MMEVCCKVLSVIYSAGINCGMGSVVDVFVSLETVGGRLSYG